MCPVLFGRASFLGLSAPRIQVFERDPEKWVPVFRRDRAPALARFRRSNMNLRNIAIIAHVDHSNTTLVDRLLQQSGTYRDNQRLVVRAMDYNDLEPETVITSLAQ